MNNDSTFSMLVVIRWSRTIQSTHYLVSYSLIQWQALLEAHWWRKNVRQTEQRKQLTW